MRPTSIDAKPRPKRQRAAAASKPAGRRTRDAAPRVVPPLGEAHFRALTESSDDVFWLADVADGRLLYMSPRVQALCGVDAESLLQDPLRWNDAVVAEDQARLPRPFFADDPSHEAVREYRVHSPDGAPRWIRDRRFHVRDGETDALRIGGLIEDVTERKQRELERDALLQRERDARAAAEAAVQAKDEFLAVVTHELRSPLNAIRGWSHVLRHSGALQALQVKSLDAIDRNTQAQASLVDDLLDSQRILCGKLQLDIGRVPLHTLAEEALETVRPAAQMKRLRLEATHDARVGIVAVDADRLRQALVKLLSNAVKFTPEDGIVTLRTQLADHALEIAVQDTGVGLEPEQLPLLFDRFQQADSSNTRRAGGLGLGLSLARQLVELHGGHIRVESEGVGRGAAFIIELPRETVCEAVAELPRASDSPLAGKRIVIVEDDDDGREVLGLILRGADVDLRSFDRAASAFEYLAHVPADEQPDALISDIAMPDEDGYAFIRRVREMEGRARKPRLVALALTSFTRVEDRVRAVKAGFDAHVAKPIDAERVLHTLAKALGLAGEEQPMPA